MPISPTRTPVKNLNASGSNVVDDGGTCKQEHGIVHEGSVFSPRRSPRLASKVGVSSGVNRTDGQQNVEEIMDEDIEDDAGEEVTEPAVGMEFETMNDVEMFY